MSTLCIQLQTLLLESYRVFQRIKPNLGNRNKIDNVWVISEHTVSRTFEAAEAVAKIRLEPNTKLFFKSKPLMLIVEAEDNIAFTFSRLTTAGLTYCYCKEKTFF